MSIKDEVVKEMREMQIDPELPESELDWETYDKYLVEQSTSLTLQKVKAKITARIKELRGVTDGWSVRADELSLLLASLEGTPHKKEGGQE